MKKLIVLLMIICLAACGCSKQDEPTATNTPTTAITETPTKSADTDSNTDKMACALCGEITDCMAFTRKIWNSDIGDYVKKVYYLCDDCYVTASRNETDCLNYEAMLENTQLAVAFKENYKIISGLDGVGYIIMDQSGVSFDNIEQGIIEQLYVIDPIFEQIKTQKTYKIKITYGKYVTVEKEIAPVSILDTITQ